MTLLDYLGKPGSLSAAALAELVGCNKSYITRLKQGVRQPSLALAFKIERATGGQVRAKALVKEAA